VSVIYIAGSTASGKSALALELAGRLDAEIVNADAFQVYRGLEILTAAPTSEERARVPHHLFGIIDANQEFHAARYAALAREVLSEIAMRGRTALVVGGSGLYIKALTHGLDDLPSDAALREQLHEMSLAEKVARLRTVDPAGAAEMNLGNPRHVERALEICLLSGRPASELKQRWRGPDDAGLRGVLLDWPRDVLNRRIGQRVDDMFARGAVEEVARIDQSCGFSNTAARAIGVREIRAFLAGPFTRDEAIASVALATRRYAKRQMTWFRSERWLKTICLDSGTTPESLAGRVAGEFSHA
jgi:tRNA dimethylallyltransferase